MQVLHFPYLLHLQELAQVYLVALSNNRLLIKTGPSSWSEDISRSHNNKSLFCDRFEVLSESGVAQFRHQKQQFDSHQPSLQLLQILKR